MAQAVSGINPRMLTWARDRAGYSIDDVADRMKKDSATIEAWEAGDAAPTYGQLEYLSYTLYKRPLALFFFPEPPSEPNPVRSFRTLPESEAQKLDPDTRLKLREAYAFQLSLIELNNGRNPAERKIFRDVDTDPDRPEEAPRVAALVRFYLGIEVETRFEWRSIPEWFKKCRSVVEEAGVYVFKGSMKQKEVSGFCLYEDEFPIIYVNNSTSASRQVFTLFHELAHVLLHVSGIAPKDPSFANTLVGDNRQVETFCNRFAAEVLVPAEHFRARTRSSVPNERFIEKLAREYGTSREVILRRFLDLGRVTPDKYEEFVDTWNQELEEEQSKRSGGGGDYYLNQIAYLGDNYLDLAFARYHQGAIDMDRLSDILRIKAQNIPNLEQKFLERGTV